MEIVIPMIKTFFFNCLHIQTEGVNDVKRINGLKFSQRKSIRLLCHVSHYLTC